MGSPESKSSVSVYAVSETTTEDSFVSSLPSSSTDGEQTTRVVRHEASQSCGRQCFSECFFCTCALLACGIFVAVFVSILMVI